MEIREVSFFIYRTIAVLNEYGFIILHQSPAVSISSIILIS